MKISIIYIYVLLVCSGFCRAGLPEDPLEYAAWEKRSLEAVGRLVQLPAEEAIPKLGEVVRKFSRENHPLSERGHRPVSGMARAALLSIPGHAKYYENRIKQARLKYEEALLDEENRNVGGTRNDLYNEQMWGFEILMQLPSPETVRVLGEFLSDERGMPNLPPNPTLMDAERARAERPNSIMAARALNELPLVTRPYPKMDMYSLRHKDVHPWRLWYEQVKAGTRTFRFEGDPQEYTLEGPVREARHGPATNRTTRRNAADGALEEERSTGFTPFRMILTGMAILLCLWALWRYWKTRPELAR